MDNEIKKQTGASASKEKRMKKLIGAALALSCILAFAGESHALESFEVPTFAGGIPYKDPSFVGLRHAIVSDGSSQADRLVLTGEYLLYAVCPSGSDEAVAGYVRVFDTDITGTIDVHTRTWLISPRLNAYNDTVGVTVNLDGPCWVPPFPVQILKGVKIAPSATSFSTVILYRTSDGSK